MEGDAIILGSDGLFDNAFDREIVSTISDIKDAAEAGKISSLFYDLTHKIAFFSNDILYSLFCSKVGS